MTIYSKVERIYIIAEWSEYSANVMFYLAGAYALVCVGNYFRRLLK